MEGVRFCHISVRSFCFNLTLKSKIYIRIGWIAAPALRTWSIFGGNTYFSRALTMFWYETDPSVVSLSAKNSLWLFTVLNGTATMASSRVCSSFTFPIRTGLAFVKPTKSAKESLMASLAWLSHLSYLTGLSTISKKIPSSEALGSCPYWCHIPFVLILLASMPAATLPEGGELALTFAKFNTGVSNLLWITQLLRWTWVFSGTESFRFKRLRQLFNCI